MLSCLDCLGILYLLEQKEFAWCLPAFFHTLLWNMTRLHRQGKFRAVVSEGKELRGEWGKGLLCFSFTTRMWLEISTCTDLQLCNVSGKEQNFFFFLLRSPAAFQLMPAQTNLWRKVRNFLFPEAPSKQKLDGRCDWVLQSPDIPCEPLPAALRPVFWH